ncbi:hypothetical protein HZB04_04175 [Candidatus Wolfebacteria bacterium]|nr:hypothetical protein [Candidatus Wolfebacteria bacterium]
MPDKQPTISQTTTDPSNTVPSTANENSSTIDQSKGKQFELEQRMDSNTKDIERLKQDLTNERLNNITIFGIFASLVTFLSVEIQVFKNIDNFWLLIGLSAFLVSSLLLFIFSIHSIARNKLGWKDFLSTPIFWLFILFLIFSFVIFVLNSKGINIDLKVSI